MSGLYEQLSGAQGLRVEGKSAQNIANFNAEVAEQEGKAAQARAGFDQIQQEKEAQRIKSRLRAGIGGAGGGGSKVETDILASQAEESELENLLIGFEGEVASQRSKSKATGLRLEGRLARQRAKSAARRANVQFGVQLASIAFLSGFGGGAPAGGTSNLSSAGISPNAGFGGINPTTGMGF